MKPYHRWTPMALRWVRRLAYGRGHGIHSPLAYALVYSLVRPYSRYYDYDQIEDYATPDALLWYRILARTTPSEVHYHLSDKQEADLLQLMQTLAVRQLHTTGTTLLATDDTASAVDLLGSAPEALVLLTGIRRSREREECFLTALTSDTLHGIVLDLYDSAILINHNDELYYYRTTL